MAWYIMCTNSECRRVTTAWDIADLIENHLSDSGWIQCSCGKDGYVEKIFRTQEEGIWEPFIKGVIPLGKKGHPYQPFVFLVSNEPTGQINDVWISYFKDFREQGGNVYLGYGPSAPPVLGKFDLITLLGRLLNLNYLVIENIKGLIKEMDVKNSENMTDPA